MPQTTFLEQLVAEWYAYRGFFVRTNIPFGKRERGGYEGEMDVVAFASKEKTLIHLETSGDSYSWAKRQRRFQKKFQMAEKHYKSIFDFEFQTVKRIAVVAFTRPKKPFGNGFSHLSVLELLKEIKDGAVES